MWSGGEGDGLSRMLADKARAAARRADLAARLRNSSRPTCSPTKPLVASPTVSDTSCPPRLRVSFSAVDRIAFEHETRVPCPHLVALLASIALQTRESAPICVVLPSTIGVASLVAIVSALECFASDLPAAKVQYLEMLKTGLRVRIYPSGDVFEVGDPPIVQEGMRLRLTDKKNYATNGTRFVPVERIFWFEPTTRRHPLGTAATFRAPPVNDLDAIVGEQSFGNSGLVRSRVLPAGTRAAEFEKILHAIHLVARDGVTHSTSLADVFPFGGADENGRPYVTNPSGAAGQPMVAIGRDLLDLRAACLAPEVEPGSRVLLSDKPEVVLRDLDLAGRIAERQRLLLFASGRSRTEVTQLRKAGWIVWEPTPRELLGLNGPIRETACPGIDQSHYSATAQLYRGPKFDTCNGPEVAKAHQALAKLGDSLADESVEHEFWVEELLDAAQSLFFSSASWLSRPTGQALENAVNTISRFRDGAPRLARFLGDSAADAIGDLADAIEEFLTSDIDETPKARQLLRMAKTASQTSLNQVFVTGNRQSRQEAETLFARHGLDARCLAGGDLSDAGELHQILCFSVMRREVFEKLVDPWPHGSVVFLGYDFEVRCYEARLARRETLQSIGRLSPEARLRLTGMAAESFASEAVNVSAPTAVTVDRGLDAFDKIAREWNWTRRISVPKAQDGEESCPATIVRFVGHSWCAMSEDHRPLVLAPSGDGGQGAADEVALSELTPGSRLLIREGADKDIIRSIAEEIAGIPAYSALRKKASLWREALAFEPAQARKVADALAKAGIHRHYVTVRSWLTNKALIAPRSDQDIHGIAEAFPLSGRSKADWQVCCDAIAELRALHIRAGGQLTHLLAERCGRILFEPSDTEFAVDLGVGTVWIVEVVSVEAQARECPVSYVNRLHWLGTQWRDRLLADPVRDVAP
jgi:hypothetical protein